MGKNKEMRRLLSNIWINKQIIDQNNQMIESMKQDLERLRDAAAGMKAITYDREKIQAAAAGDRMGDMVVELVDAEKKDLEKIAKLTLENNNLERERTYLIHCIKRLDNAKCSEFLYKRYVERKTINEIQEEMKFGCYNACTNFHSYSLKIFKAFFESQENIINS